jgi:uncharacterized protein (DUF302 family)
MGLMDSMVKFIKKEKREEMMVNMMPQMMEGLDINELMPKMLVAMLKDVTSEDIADYLRKTLEDKEKLQEMANKILEANPMARMMMKKHKSKLGFEETVNSLMDNIPKNNWSIPDTRDLQKLWREEGIQDAPKMKILYLCNAKGGYDITREDELLPMTVMMPMGLSIYETSKGEVEIAFMNLGMMSGMFTGVPHDVLKSSAQNLENAIKNITH